MNNPKFILWGKHQIDFKIRQTHARNKNTDQFAGEAYPKNKVNLMFTVFFRL